MAILAFLQILVHLFRVFEQPVNTQFQGCDFIGGLRRIPIDDKEQLVGPGTVLVNRPGYQFFSRFGFSLDQNGGIGLGHPADGFVHGLHGPALAEDGIT